MAGRIGYGGGMSLKNRYEPSEIAQRIAASRGAHSVSLAGSGTEFLFYTATLDGNQEGYRIPRTPEFNTANNQGVSAMGIQRQEMALAAWASDGGLPSTQPVDLIEQDGFPVLILTVVDDDGSELDAKALGSIVARMHQRQLPQMDFVAQNGLPVSERIVQRLEQRYSELGKNVHLPALPPAARMLRDLEEHLGQPRLAHLDIRRQNVRVMDGHPHSIFDWSNALGAPPELEIARIEEYAAIDENGLDYEAFRLGYAREGGTVGTESPAWPLLRLDTAVMLAVVFSSVAPNDDLRELFVARLSTLVKQL